MMEWVGLIAIIGAIALLWRGGELLNDYLELRERERKLAQDWEDSNLEARVWLDNFVHEQKIERSYPSCANPACNCGYRADRGEPPCDAYVPDDFWGRGGA